MLAIGDRVYNLDNSQWGFVRDLTSPMGEPAAFIERETVPKYARPAEWVLESRLVTEAQYSKIATNEAGPSEVMYEAYSSDPVCDVRTTTRM